MKRITHTLINGLLHASLLMAFVLILFHQAEDFIKLSEQFCLCLPSPTAHFLDIWYFIRAQGLVHFPIIVLCFGLDGLICFVLTGLEKKLIAYLWTGIISLCLILWIIAMILAFNLPRQQIRNGTAVPVQHETP